MSKKETREIVEKLKDSKHFCILPWIHFHAWPDDRVMPCCVADSQKPVAIYEPGAPIIEMMNSTEFKTMRRLMLEDKAYEPCNRCYDLEKLGEWTLRKSQNTNFLSTAITTQENVDETAQVLLDTHKDGTIDEFKMKYMDIRFSNLCNYKCRSCGPACSNLWGEEKLKLADENEWINRKGRDALMTINKHGIFMSDLKPYLNDVQECYFAGGEILIHPEHYECLDYWIDNDLAKNVRLNYTTNMSKLTYQDKIQGERDIFDLWKHFPNIELWASIDAIGKEGEFIRKGFRWKNVKKNLLAIKERAPHIKIGLTPTISIWNIWYFLDMFDWMYDNGFISKESPMRLNMLTQPKYADIRILPEPIRDEFRKKVRVYIERFSHDPDDVEILNSFLKIQQALRTGSFNKELLTEFFKENDVLDGLRAENIENFKEYKELREWID